MSDFSDFDLPIAIPSSVKQQDAKHLLGLFFLSDEGIHPWSPKRIGGARDEIDMEFYERQILMGRLRVADFHSVQFWNRLVPRGDFLVFTEHGRLYIEDLIDLIDQAPSGKRSAFMVELASLRSRYLIAGSSISSMEESDGR